MPTNDETLSHNLPDWMRRARRGLDWGILLVFVMALTVACPFIFNADLPYTNANENYVFRTADYAKAIQQGWFYPRWSPNVLGGYGAPIPSFYPPLPAYSAALIQVLLTNDPVIAIRLLYIMSICVGAASVYALVMRRTEAQSGVIAAALYLYSPYIKLVAPQIVGDLPGMMILALIPFLLWTVDRLLTSTHPQDALLVSLAWAGLCLTSIRGVMAGFVILGVVVCWYKWHYRRASIRQLIISIALGAGIAGFHWIPALLESYAIHWQSLVPAEVFRLGLAALLSPLRPIDPTEMIISPQFTLGAIGTAFTAISLVIALRTRKLSFEGMYLGLGVGTACIALLLFPNEVWLTGLISLFIAIGNSQLLRLRRWLSIRWRRSVGPVILVIVWLGSLTTWVIPRAERNFGATDAAAQVQYEQSGFGIPVLAPGELLPSSLPQNLPPNRLLIDSYVTGNVNKLVGGSVGAGFQASPLSHESHSDRFQVRRISQTITLNVLTAFFPGWTASLSGQTLALRPDSETGLIEIDLPAQGGGNNELIISMGSTNVRSGAWIISLSVLGIGTIQTWGRFRRRRSRFEDQRLLNLAETRLMALPILSFLIVAIAISANIAPLTPYVRPGFGLDGSFMSQSRTDAGLVLTGFQIRSNLYSRGEIVDMTFFWQTQRFLTENYQVKLWLTNSQDGSQWSLQSPRHPGYFPTQRWNTQQYVSDRYHVRLADNIPAGNYQIQLSIDTCGRNLICSENTELTFFSTAGQSIGSIYTLPTLISVR